nr:dense granule protein 10 [Eimeria intestinalis]
MRHYDMMVVDAASELAAAIANACMREAESSSSSAAAAAAAAPAGGPAPAAAGVDGTAAPGAAAPSTATGAGTSVGGAVGGENGSSSKSGSDDHLYLVPCCLSGGGSAFSVGGFVRLRADNRVSCATDRVAADLLSQWQLQGPPPHPVCPSDGPRPGGVMGGAPHADAAPAYVLRVNWIEKYGRMPVLPSRKQPLCGLFGGSRRGPHTMVG